MPNPVPSAQPSGQPQARQPNWILWIAGGCGCLAMVGVAGCVGFFILIKATLDKLAKPMTDHVAKVQAGDLKGAYGDLSSDVQNELSLDEFEQVVKKNPNLYKGSNYSWSKFETTGGITKLEGTNVGPDGNPHPLTAWLVTEKGSEKILKFKIGAE